MAESVRAMFASIAPRYDAANTVLSLGLHQRWRRRLVGMSQPPSGGSVLDVATGTGDLAFLYRQAVGPRGHVVGVDFCPPMLDRARAKAERADLEVEFREGDALQLPFRDAEFDVASIAFGVRNVDNPDRCIRELARVVRPGGRVAVLEFGQPGGLLRWPYRAYSRFFIPLAGAALTGNRRAYRYLPRTAASFPSGSRFAELMDATGRFVQVHSRSISGGIVFAYVGVVGPHERP